MMLLATTGLVEASDSTLKQPPNRRVESEAGMGGIQLAAANGAARRVKALIEGNPQLANSMASFRWLRLQQKGTNFPVRLRELLTGICKWLSMIVLC
jgi:hypothetical protein